MNDNEMERFLRIINGDMSVNTSEAKPTNPIGENDPAYMRNDMVRLMSGLRDGVQELKQDAKTDRTLREAIITKQTDAGVKIGEYEIIVHDDDGQKSFDVMENDTYSLIAAEMSLYESAHAIVRLLNSGFSKNSSKINEIVSLDEQYGRGLADAVICRHRAKKLNETGQYDRAEIMEIRYDSAKVRALTAQNTLARLIERM